MVLIQQINAPPRSTIAQAYGQPSRTQLFDLPRSIWTMWRLFDNYRRMLSSSDAVESLAALAQEHRLAAYRLLVQAGEPGLSAGAISEHLDLPPSSLSFHLTHLVRAGLIEQQRQGRSQIYRANYVSMTGLIDFLTENCCGGAACGPAVACVPAAREDAA
jgi:DNA-binding transcriptional ArsR family regulator